MGEKIGIMGGSFDPIHLGHLIIAQDAREQFQLDRVLFVPAHQAPLKTKQPVASPAQRRAMTQLAIDGQPHFQLSDVDLAHQGVSYSIDTARRLQNAHPQAHLHWILGADQLAQLHLWRDIEALSALVAFIAFERDGPAAPNEKLPPSSRVLYARPRPLQISSTEIRERLYSGRPVKYFLPAPVFDHINAKNPYR